jgi:hypothetical protein
MSVLISALSDGMIGSFEIFTIHFSLLFILGKPLGIIMPLFASVKFAHKSHQCVAGVS